MENQHRKIAGYRELTQVEIDLMNEIKEQGNNLGIAVDAIEEIPNVDQRALAIAKTHLQTGLMWLTRAIAKPESF